jgi:hypothetical protein
VLVRIIAIDVAAAAAFITCWYFWFLRSNRRRAVQVLGWIERAFDGHAQIVGVNWLSASRFQLRLRLSPSLFRQSFLTVQLFPRELPVHWLVARLRRKHETLTFEADLDVPPSFNLDVHNHRWCGRTRRKFPKASENWVLERAGAFVITTRNDWQREITNIMNPLMASRQCDCLTVSFRRTSPNFSATVPLDTISPCADSETNIFDVLRELAAGASASRF